MKQTQEISYFRIFKVLKKERSLRKIVKLALDIAQ